MGSSLALARVTIRHLPLAVLLPLLAALRFLLMICIMSAMARARRRITTAAQMCSSSKARLASSVERQSTHRLEQKASRMQSDFRRQQISVLHRRHNSLSHTLLHP